MGYKLFVACYPKGIMLLHTAAYAVFLCTAGNIRLVNGSVASEGTVELFYEGQWGRVVVDSSDTAAARVACRQAGYLYMEGTQSFGRGSGPVWLVIRTCTGSEERLERCEHWGWRFNPCPWCADLGVRCGGEYTHDGFGVSYYICSLAACRSDLWK